MATRNSQCHYCGDEIRFDPEYGTWFSETARCLKSPRFPYGQHQPALSAVT